MTDTIKVAVLDDYLGIVREVADWHTLPGHVEVKIFTDHLSDEDAIVKTAAGFCSRSRHARADSVPKNRFSKRLPNLRLLITLGRANASFDVAFATEAGIVVSGTGGN